MQIKMLVAMSSGEGSWAPGDIYETADENECRRLIEAEFAERIAPVKRSKVETATAE